MWSGKEFLDYDRYKLDISSIGDKIWDEIDLSDDENDFNFESDDLELDSEDVEVENNMEDNTEEIDEEYVSENMDKSEDMDKRAIKAFPRSVKFVDFSQIADKKVSEMDWNLEWYSKSDLLWVIGKYLEENLNTPTSWNRQSIYFSSKLLGNSSDEIEGEEEKVTKNSVGVTTEKVSGQKNTKSVQRSTSSNSLTQKEQKEAEEIFSILF